MLTRILGLGTLLFTSLQLHAEYPIRLASHPSLSPDGKTILFSWNGDIWSASSQGGQATRLTSHPAYDYSPRFTPDGKSICFGSTRAGGYQIFTMRASGGSAQQITTHSEGSFLEDIAPDGKSILIRAIRDYPGRRPYRLYSFDLTGTEPARLLFQATAQYGRYTDNGKSVLFTREGSRTYRKGYHGAMASQVWQWTPPNSSFQQPVKNSFGCREPISHPDGSGFYYTQGSPNGFNLWFHHNTTGKNRQITHFEDDSVMQAHIAANGSAIVFRHLFDLYVLPLDQADRQPRKLNLFHREDLHQKAEEERVVKSTNETDFSPSGLEIIFTAEGDIWAMDTVLKKPHRLTNTPAHEQDIWFSHDGKSILYIHDDGIQTELRRLKKSKPGEFWWQANNCRHATIVKPSQRPIQVIPGPKGKKIAYITYPGNLWVSEPDGSNPVRLLESWSRPDVEWSPDGQWLAYSVQNNNFNPDIFITRADGSSAPVNISRHPDINYSPAWSPDGRRLAFIGRHHKETYDIFYLELYKSDTLDDKHGETLERARKAMGKDPAYKNGPKAKVKKTIEKLAGKKKPNKDESFYLENIHQRLQKIQIKGLTPRSILWSHDSKKIIFQTREQKKQTFAVEAKPGAKFAKIADAAGTPVRMDKKGNLYWLSSGVPAVLKGNKNTTYPFSLYTKRNLSEWKRMAFRKAWNTMRDSFYDPKMNNRDWQAVRKKYEDTAATASDPISFERTINMMLGELNASHMGYRTSSTWAKRWTPDNKWKEETVHLGIRQDPAHAGDGWKVLEVIPESPADFPQTRILPGEIITHINGEAISSASPAFSLLKQRTWSSSNKMSTNPVLLNVNDKEGKSREIKIQPITYRTARSLAQNARINTAKKTVNQLSGGKLGYIHIAQMMWSEFEKFEHHLYEQGTGKEGLVIDVRDNGGGFTTDHLLTSLCQPHHAYTIPRNGDIGYPQDRIVYATWHKPIIVLCNQNSFSNAEIFAHAIKHLKRGKLVGVSTAGGVISTSSRKVLDTGTIRLPFRGWFRSSDGQDMELHGAQPDITLWNLPGELSQGKDTQLQKAVQVLLEECKNTPTPPKPKYRSAK